MAKETQKPEENKTAAEKTEERADASGTREVDTDGAVQVVAVEHPGSENTDEEFLKSQDEAYLRYRVTGEQGAYIDSLRDQEPDIAPEFGVAPHPEMANARAPEGFFTGVNLDPESNPVVKPVEEKIAEADVNLVDEAKEGAEKANRESEEATKEAEAGPQKANEEGQFAGRVADESPKASQGNVRAQG